MIVIFGSYRDMRKPETCPFRLPEEMADLLETESTIRNINTSTLLAQICNHYFGYDGNTGRAGLVAFPRQLLIKLMESQSEKQVIAMAEHNSKDAMTDIMSVLESAYTVDNFLHLVQSWAHASRIPFRREIKGQLNTVVIQPQMGKNWSLYLGHLFKNVTEEITGKRVAIQVTDQSVMFRF